MVSPVSYLLDTNIFVHLTRADDTGRKIERTFGLCSMMHRCMISAVTAGEIESLIWQFKWGEKKRDVIHSLLREVVSIDLDQPEIIEAYGIIDSKSRSMGRKMGKNDACIAATANVTGATLLTADKDFEHLHGKYLTRILA